MKRALVTGASGGLGSAICRKLAERGFHVIAHAHQHREKACELAEEIRSGGGSAEVVTFDVTDAARCEACLLELNRQVPIQVIVNNAGVHSDAPMAGMSLAQWREAIDVSLNGFFNVTRPLLLPMIRTRWGRVVNISSVAGVMGNRGQVNYAAAKAGLHGATKSLAAEVASRGITVNAVAPGFIDAGMAASMSDTVVQSLVPAKRAGTPDEVAGVVAFLVSAEAAYITGQILSVNGGMI